MDPYNKPFKVLIMLLHEINIIPPTTYVSDQ